MLQRRKKDLMRTRCFLIGTVVLLALLASAWAADVTGQWKAQAQGADITITLKVDGNTVTGTLDNSMAGPTDIKEGKIDGDEISFYVVRKLGENDTKITWKGKVAGDEIKFTRQAQGGNAEEIVAKRVK
jgi:hypothetical protein